MKYVYYWIIPAILNNSVFDDDVVIVNQNKWRARAFFGVRLGKR